MNCSRFAVSQQLLRDSFRFQMNSDFGESILEFGMPSVLLTIPRFDAAQFMGYRMIAEAAGISARAAARRKIAWKWTTHGGAATLLISRRQSFAIVMKR